MIKITSQEMRDFSRYLAEISGVLIDEGKKYLLENRLQSILATEKCNSFHELLFSAKNEKNICLRTNVIDAITTNETYFFRDKVPFEILRYKIIPDIIDRKKRLNTYNRNQIRIWCAACSTGQEVYSVIMSILETVPDISKYDIRVLGTDISNRVLAQASSGLYSRHEAERGLPSDLRNKYFVEENGSWRVRDEVRIMADFKRMNLLEPFYGIGPFDIILCRNVSIYFSEQNKIRLFKKIGRILDNEGYLIVGGSESLNEVAPQFTCHRHLKGMYYQRKDATPVTVNAKRYSLVPNPAPRNGAEVRKKLIRPLPSPVVHTNTRVRGTEVIRSTEKTITGISDRKVTEGCSKVEKSGQPFQSCDKIQVIKQDENLGEKIISPLLLDTKSFVGDEGQTLLGSIRGRHNTINSVMTWRSAKQGEPQKSLLEVIWENNEMMEPDKESEGNE